MIFLNFWSYNCCKLSVFFYIVLNLPFPLLCLFYVLASTWYYFPFYWRTPFSMGCLVTNSVLFVIKCLYFAFAWKEKLFFIGSLVGGLWIKLIKMTDWNEKRQIFLFMYVRGTSRKMWLKAGDRIWGIYHLNIGEGKREGHLWENKLLLGKINGSVGE